MEQRLYSDPYACAFYPGSSVQEWMGTNTIDSLYDWIGMKGFSEMISIRTKWLDDNIKTANFSDDMKVWEVDQPDVQKKKRDKLQWLIDQGNSGTCSALIQEIIQTKRVQFVPVDFNSDSVEERLASQQGFETNLSCAITLEGVTQYIPKESTADTLKKLRGIVAPGSTLLMTYVDQKVLDDDPELPKSYHRIKGLAGKVGETWISGFTKSGVEEFLKA
ncbi:MAG: hypothetical protein SGILL_002978, partial [Bacillariaceae sp.]